MFSSLEDFAKNQKSFMIGSNLWNYSMDNLDSFRVGLTQHLNNEGWSEIYHNLSHLSKLGILKNEVFVTFFKGWTGLTNYRFYYNSDSGLLSIPISSIIKYFDYSTSNNDELNLAIEFCKSKDEDFENCAIIYKKLNGGFEILNVEALSSKYLKNIVNEGEYLDLDQESTLSIYKTRTTLKKKYTDLEDWSMDDLIQNLGDHNQTEQINENLINNDLFENIEDENIKELANTTPIRDNNNRKYTIINEDKFNKTKTITWNSWSTKPGLGSQLHAQASLGIIWYLDSIAIGGVSEGLGMGMRIIEKDSSRIIAIDYEYHRWDWMYLGRGYIQIAVDNNNVIELNGNEARTKVYSEGNKGGKIFEKGYWIISETEFKQICDSNIVNVRITGGSGFHIEFDESHNDNFVFMLRSMYNESYDSSLYVESINEREIKVAESKGRGKKIVKIILSVIGILLLLLLVRMCS